MNKFKEFHTEDKILVGTFLGNYIFSNNITFNGKANFTNLTVSGAQTIDINGAIQTFKVIIRVHDFN